MANFWDQADIAQIIALETGCLQSDKKKPINFSVKGKPILQQDGASISPTFGKISWDSILFFLFFSVIMIANE